jgi:hypothetical protein
MTALFYISAIFCGALASSIVWHLTAYLIEKVRMWPVDRLIRQKEKRYLLYRSRYGNSLEKKNAQR